MLRPIRQEDIPQLLKIEASVHVVPWTRETFLTCFQSHYLGWGIEQDHHLVAFIMVSVQADECHILNISVARASQRQGLASQLMNAALLYAREHAAAIAYLEVRRSNAGAIALYHRLGFMLIGERKDYYPVATGYEDALIFAKKL